MFQFAFDGALFTLKQKRPEAVPLFTKPPETRAQTPPALQPPSQ